MRETTNEWLVAEEICDGLEFLSAEGRVEFDTEVELDGMLVQVERKDVIAVEGLLYTDGQAEAYAVPDDCKALVGLVYELTKQYNELSEKLGHAKAELLERMGETNASRWEYGRMQVIRKEGGVRKTFDSKRFEAYHADMYGQYMKESESKPSITIKIK